MSKRQYTDDDARLSKSCNLCKLKKVRCDGAEPRCGFCVKSGVNDCLRSVMKRPGLKPGYGKTMSHRLEVLEREVSSLKHGMTQIHQPERVNNGLPPANTCLVLINLFFEHIIPIFPLIHPSVRIHLKDTLQDPEPPLLLYSIVLISLKFLDDMPIQQKSVYYKNCEEKVITISLRKINIESLQSMILLAYDSLSGSVKVPESWNYVSIAADYATYLKLGQERAKLTLVSDDSPDSAASNGTDHIARKKSKSISNKSLNLLRKPNNWVDEESRRYCFWCIYTLDKHFAISSSHEMKLKSSKITTLLPLRLDTWKASSEPVFIQLRTLKQVGFWPTEEPQIGCYDSFAFYVELNKLVGDIHTFLIEDFDIYSNSEILSWRMKFKTLETQLYGWMTSLPIGHRELLERGTLSQGQLPQTYDALLFVYYHTTLIKLHSAFGFPSGESELFKANEDSKVQCMDAATRVHTFVLALPDLFHDDQIFEKLGPHFGFYIWVNSRILFVDAVYQSTKRKLDRISLENHQKVLLFFADVLHRIGKYWESSKVYYKILHFLNVSDLSYVLNIRSTEEEEEDEENITGEHRAPAKVISDMRIGSHSLLYWFNQLAGKSSRYTTTPKAEVAGFQSFVAQPLEEFQLTHDDFFNFLAMDINGSGSFQDLP